MSITLDPTAPADSESPRQGASRIRALTLQVLGLFTQAGGSAVTFTNAPFVASTNGEITVSGLKHVIPVRAAKTFTAVSVTSSPTTITTQALTMPTLGGPFRVHISYNAFFSSFSGNANVVTWISDGTNKFAAFQISSPTFAGCCSASEFSPVTYANAAVVTFTLLGQSSSATESIGGTSAVGSLSSRYVLTVFSSV